MSVVKSKCLVVTAPPSRCWYELGPTDLRDPKGVHTSRMVDGSLGLIYATVDEKYILNLIFTPVLWTRSCLFANIIFKMIFVLVTNTDVRIFSCEQLRPTACRAYLVWTITSRFWKGAGDVVRLSCWLRPAWKTFRKVRCWCVLGLSNCVTRR